MHGDDGPAGREQVRLSVKKALNDKLFIAKFVSQNNLIRGLKVRDLYRDYEVKEWKL